MTTMYFVPHRLAIQDEEEIVRYFVKNSSEQIAVGFVNALDNAFSQLSQYPHLGSPRPEHDLDFEGVRAWSLRRFPHQIYYNVHDDHVELWRILHPRRDITQAMLSDPRLQ